ncbi:MAG: SUMF1/EgtB/PvdO family nonheme iron enzyme [Armatimonadetes bacterium]|nr:SUMF1/EgtB/PvdO family nonheme iron enzyme [Armatimonadota bacterium]
MRIVPLLIALGTVFLAATPGPAEVHAVLIGIDRYDSEDITPLRFTVSDVTAFRDLLVDPAVGGAKPENVVLLTPQSEGNLRPTRTGVMVQIKKAALRTAPTDTFIFYFAGHGMETAEGQYLLGVDADPLLLADTAVPLARLPGILGDVKAGQVLVIIDACRNDPNAGRSQVDNQMGEAFARGLRPKVLSPNDALPKKVATWLACAVGERAWEITDQKHGVFSSFLLEGLRGGAAKDGEVRLGTLAEYVSAKVADWARRNGKTQTPKLDNPDGLNLVMARPRPHGPGAVREVPLARIQIESTPPGATVLLDGEAKGTTPFVFDYALPDGREKEVTVKLELAGHTPGAATIKLVPGATATWKKELSKQAAVVIPSEPLPPVTKTDQGAQQDDTPPPPVEHAGTWLKGWEAGPDGLPVVAIQSGSFQMGSAKPQDPNEGPAHEVGLEGYYIQAHEVTNAAYASFLNRMVELGLVDTDDEDNVVSIANEKLPAWIPDVILAWTSSPNADIYFDDEAGEFAVEPGRENHPATHITYAGATYYAGAYGMTLPTEAQWERAALGSDPNWRYPWGASMRPKLVNLGSEDRGTLPAVSLPEASSAAGCLHMLGNVWEWTSDFYVADYHRRNLNYEPKIEADAENQMQVTLRGGGFTFPADMVSNQTRRAGNIWLNEPDIGFRCVYKKAAAPGNDDDAQPTHAAVTHGEGGFTAVRHPLTGVTLAVPEGFQHIILPPAQVVLMYPEGELEDASIAMGYFPVGPMYQSFEQVQTAMQTELSNLGVVVTQMVQDGLIDVGNPEFQIHRRAMRGVSQGEEWSVVIDAIKHKGKYHGLMLGATPDFWEEAWEAYQVLLQRTDFPQ